MMAANDGDRDLQQRHELYVHVAETHERAAAIYAEAVDTLEHAGDFKTAEHERVLAYEQRQKALVARQRADNAQ